MATQVDEGQLRSGMWWTTAATPRPLDTAITLRGPQCSSSRSAALRATSGPTSVPLPGVTSLTRAVLRPKVSTSCSSRAMRRSMGCATVTVTMPTRRASVSMRETVGRE